MLLGRKDKDIASIVIIVLQCVCYGQRGYRYCKHCHHIAAVCVLCGREYKDDIGSILIIVLQYVFYGAERIKILQALSSYCTSVCVMGQRGYRYYKHCHHCAAVCVMGHRG